MRHFFFCTIHRAGGAWPGAYLAELRLKVVRPSPNLAAEAKVEAKVVVGVGDRVPRLLTRATLGLLLGFCAAGDVGREAPERQGRGGAGGSA